MELFVDAGYLSPYALSAFVALRVKAVPFALRAVDLGAGEQRRPAHRSRSLTGRVPTLVDGDWSLSESSAIAEYLDDTRPGIALYPADPRERARARQVQAWLRSDLGALCAERSTEVVFLGTPCAPLSPAARAQADALVEAAGTLLRPGATGLFARWCIADVDLATMLRRLAREDDGVPAALLDYAARQWARPDVEAWLALPRGAAAR